MIGGLENMAYMLASEWSKANVEVTVITNAKQKKFNDENESFKILRNPSSKIYWQAYKNVDLIFFLNISLKGIWPLLLKPKPAYVSHQITYINFDGSINFLEQIKRKVSGFLRNISCSDFVRGTLPKKNGVVIHNAYDSRIFTEIIPYQTRTKDIVFVGRMVSDKGLDTLIHAMAILKYQKQKSLNLTAIGDGPELISLKKLSIQLGIDSQITFIGSLTGLVLSKIINEHRIMVVPSKWNEPFGLVALEGLACGCKMIVSKHGGLKEAAGNMALEFENGDPYSLSDAIIAIEKEGPYIFEKRKLHLKNHTNEYISQQYLTLFTENESLK